MSAGGHDADCATAKVPASRASATSAVVATRLAERLRILSSVQASAVVQGSKLERDATGTRGMLLKRKKVSPQRRARRQVFVEGCSRCEWVDVVSTERQSALR
mmetsp:Transcript_20941/g.65105  ORF Transcript_20941/g.65105 Transcript_20941/m.65105 type:complete len:103 (-) Transcript_20941:49-357(-)